ncbi:hypothetical protein [Myroides marinus]|uniref:hypothetical protein n=1 Tax=Myroides marinus TaxID=703342 RepID=UPI002578C35C|nr:hypothetical protein [Myroides marinus]MDM1373373.1 hypothetical protein [Myroides marinus]
MSSATARFLNIALAKENKELVSRTFSNAFIIHLFLCFIVLFLGETIGLYFILNVLQFPYERLDAVKIVYQLSLITSCIAILQIPYYALLIAYEKMKAIAYIGILQSLLSLVIVYLLKLKLGDNLIVYAFLVFLVSIVIRVVYISYCTKNIKESKLKLTYESEIAKPILSFFSWDLYGNFSVAVRGEGIMILLNMFFGAIINASTGIANQVQGVLNSLIDNFLIAIRPQLVQSYAKGDFERMFALVFLGGKLAFILMLLISLPIYTYMDLILNLWLKNVPDFAVSFCRLSLLFTLISIMFRTVMFAIHATGRVRLMSMINGTLYILILPISWFFLYSGFLPTVVFTISISLMFIGQVSNTLLLKKYIKDFNIKMYYIDVVSRSVFIAIINYCIINYLSSIFIIGFVNMMVVSVVSCFLVLLFAYMMGINKKERRKLNMVILKKWKKIY